MYESHFQLRARPFAETVDPASYVPLPARDAALHRLRYGLEGGAGLVVAVGPPGVGKTLLVNRLLRDLPGPAVWLTFPNMPAAEWMAFLADEIDPTGDRSARSLGASIARLRGSLANASARGDRPMVIVDESHLIRDSSTFESLRLLLNFASQGGPDLSLLLVGLDDLIDRLPPALCDRLGARCTVAPLTLSESAAYVMGRLALAGAQAPLFEIDALKALHTEADGVPRRLNRLADLALLIAYARDQEAPNVETVRLAANEAGFERAA